MKLIPFTLLAVLGGLATNHYLRQRRQAAGGWTGMPAAGSSSSASMDSDLPGAAGTWPEAAARAGDEERAGAPMGGAMDMGGMGGGPEDDLFGSSSQRGPEPATTGLPDLTRGA